MQAKEALVRKSAFSRPPPNFLKPPAIRLGLAYIKITEETVGQALLTQAATKAPGSDKINFQVLQMIWNWEKARITSMVYHAIQLGYHPME